MSEDELVSILVPRKHLSAIYAFIGSLDASEHGIGSSTNGAAAGEGGWTSGLIERQYRESPDSMKRFQRLLADEPGKEFSTSDVVAALDVPYGWNSVAGMLGAYGNRVKNRYKQTTFPFQTRWEGDGEALHSMTPEVASIIREL